MGIVNDLLESGEKIARLNYEIQKDKHLTGAQREANAFTTAEREASQDWAEDMYNKYQSPEAQISSQIAGFKANGINPALMYGGSAPSGGSIPAVSGGSSVSPSTGRVSEIFENALNMKRLEIEQDRVNKEYEINKERNQIQAELNPSKIAVNNATAWRNMTAGNLNELDGRARSAMNAARLSLIYAQTDSEIADAALKRSGISVNDAKIGLIYQQALNQTIANKFANQYWQAEIDLKRANEENNFAAAAKARAEISKIQQDAVNSATFGEILNQQFEQNEISTEMMRYQERHKEASYWVGLGAQAIGAIAGAASAGSGISRAVSYGKSVANGAAQYVPYGEYSF